MGKFNSSHGPDLDFLIFTAEIIQTSTAGGYEETHCSTNSLFDIIDRMKKSSIFFLFLASNLLASVTHAQALLETTNLLNSPTERGKVIANDPKAQQANAQVQNLGISDSDQQKVYELSSKIFEGIAAKSNGDPNKMNDQVQGYLRDPSSIEKDLTPDQKSQIHTLSTHEAGPSGPQ
jgi:hypothetical protein